MIHIYEHAGVMLHVDYTPGTPEPVFNRIHVMDDRYRPIGPDLTPLLHDSLIIVPGEEPITQAQTILSAIVEELPCL